jgi:hypothetical protein
VADFGTNAVSVLNGIGAGKFAKPVAYPSGFGAVDVKAGDFNGDGVPDLVLPAAGSNAISLLLGKGDGTFATAVNMPTGNYPVGVAVGDFNGDGNLDVATAADNSYTVSVLLGNGKGSFAPHVDYPVGADPAWMLTADLNLDGKLDLVTANAGDDNISVLLGKGDGTFQSATNYVLTGGANPYQVAVGDFNHDGKPDLAVADFNTNTISILMGNGDGTFQPHVEYPTTSFPFGIVVGDFNGDGALDLAVTDLPATNANCFVSGSECPGTLSLLFGNGDGTFQPHVDYPVGLSPVGLAEADLNGDGGADLAVANSESGTVSLLLNLPVIGIFPNALNFGAEKVSVKSNPQTITIGNPSGTPITVKKPTLSGADAADFAQTTTCPLSPATLAPGLSCSVVVTFTPKAAGARSATLKIADSVPGSPQLVSLGGTGQ